MKSTIITASAGTGKTYQITEELASRIAEGLDPAAVIATTFTKKAAAELAERIRSKLMDRGLTAAAQSVNAALVGTVNSVASRIVQDFAIDAGLSPMLDILEDEAGKRAFSVATDDIIAVRDAEHQALLKRTGYDRPADAYQYDPRLSWPRTVQDITEAARQNLLTADDLRDSINPSIEEVMSLLDAVADPETSDSRNGLWKSNLIQACDEAIALDEGDDRNAARSRVDKHTKWADQARTDVFGFSWAEWAGFGKISTPKSTAAAFEIFSDISTDIAANPAFREDIRTLIELTLTTAADCIEAYRDYKDALGLLDFIDQEVMALEVIQSSERVREAVADSYEVLVVDEFQDTSPLQLSLFFALGELVGEIIWVGDPKQSIYGFRGSDPLLMDAAIEAVKDNGGDLRVLDKSWRSHAQPLQLSNEIFAATIDESARLTVAEPVAEKRRDGRVQIWNSNAKSPKNADWYGSIAAGVIRWIREDGLAPEDIAVLARTNSQVKEISASLQAAGVPCSSGISDPRQTREGQIVQAALGFLLDARDTQSLTELIHLMDDHQAHQSWFSDLTSSNTRDERRDLFTKWAKDPSLKLLVALRETVVDLTPDEIIRQVIDATDLRRRIARWTNPDERTESLGAISAMALEYMNEAKGTGAPVSPTGFLLWFKDAEAPDQKSEKGVYVGTVHSAKGLEWEAVCVIVPKPTDWFFPFGHRIESLRPPTIEDPLGGRFLRFWPAIDSKLDTIITELENHRSQLIRRNADNADARRLSYVALTRAVRISALAPIKDFSGLSALNGTEVSLETAGDFLQIKNNDGLLAEVPVEISALSIPEDGELESTGAVPHSQDILRTTPSAPGFPSRVTPSGIRTTASQIETVAVTERAVLGDPLVDKGGQNWNHVGDAIHSYLGLPLDSLPDADKLSSATRLINSWNVSRYIDPERIIELGERWRTWIDTTYPGAKILTEVPITWRNEHGQVSEGWIDQLLMLPDASLVLIDHKSYPGPEPVDHVRKEYIGQLSAYADALELAGHSRPTETLVHLPLKGLVLALDI